MISIARATAVHLVTAAATVVAGVTLAVPSARADSGPTPVSRIYISQSGEHLFADYNEITVLLGNPIWHAEAPSFAAFFPSGAPCAAGTLTVNRIVAAYTGEHLLISDPHETSVLLSLPPLPGDQAPLYAEGVALCAYATQVPGTIPVIRLFNSITGLHMWTATQAEIAALNGHG